MPADYACTAPTPGLGRAFTRLEMRVEPISFAMMGVDLLGTESRQHLPEMPGSEASELVRVPEVTIGACASHTRICHVVFN